ncbi:hypothetical protein LCGC14_0408560 [marine sediment metagenome]|uniref:Uncharacterized protein n=1 Tax=marine sediment metagenome TaxID=412755 RepID=A0A0F9T049_9ZZZZ
MITTKWHEALVDIDRSTEFTGDDVDRYSKLVDLKGSFEFITVIVPTLSTSGIVTPYIQKTDGVDTVTPANGEVPVAMVTMDGNATGHFAHATSSGAGGIVTVFRIGGAEYVRVHVSQNQSADRTFYVRGFNR